MITASYTCAMCQTTERKFRVRARGADEAICDWIEVVREAMGKAHSEFAPYCRSTTCDLRIPIDKAEGARIGDPVK